MSKSYRCERMFEEPFYVRANSLDEAWAMAQRMGAEITEVKEVSASEVPRSAGPPSTAPGPASASAASLAKASSTAAASGRSLGEAYKRRYQDAYRVLEWVRLALALCIGLNLMGMLIGLALLPGKWLLITVGVLSILMLWILRACTAFAAAVVDTAVHTAPISDREKSEIVLRRG